MTEKIQITQPQAEVVQMAMKTKENREAVLGYVARGVPIPNRSYRVLSVLPFDDLARVLYEPDSYEVKPAFEVGQYVSKTDGNLFSNGSIAAKVKEIHSYRLILDGPTGHYTLDFIRPSTPEETKAEKERQLWAKIGREVGDFLINDKIVYKNETIRIVSTGHEGLGFSEVRPSLAKSSYLGGQIKGFYPVESFVSFEEDSDV